MPPPIMATVFVLGLCFVAIVTARPRTTMAGDDSHRAVARIQPLQSMAMDGMQKHIYHFPNIPFEIFEEECN
jgi:cytochrome bd-type quinol oxidase subunit 1